MTAWSHWRVLIFAVAMLVGSTVTTPTASAAWNSNLTRYPYLTDVTTTSVNVTWADRYINTRGRVTWGLAGSDCATFNVAGSSLGKAFSVAGVSQYQHSIAISGLTPNTSYCYRIRGGTGDTVDLLDSDPSPVFKTLPESGPFSFAVFGDWGDTSTGSNPNQAALHSLLAQSGVHFALSTGDIAYPSGTQTQYGDLLATGTSVSQVFGPEFWRAPGAVTPLFATPGNHGRMNTFFQIWPQPASAAEPGESYQTITYPASDTGLGYAASMGPAGWYAFSVAGQRFYLLSADWSDSNTGNATGALCSIQFDGETCPEYEVDADVHWRPDRPEYQWLKADLEANPGNKFAVFHYPLRSDSATEPGSVYLQNSAENPARDVSLEKLLADNGVKIAFNGHAHLYQRNLAPPGGVVSYVTGGGGAALTPIAKRSLKHCSTTDAYGLGWSSSGGSYCGAAGANPTSASKVFHYLHVTVDGDMVTIAPTNADGEQFDVITYDFGPDAQAPSAPAVTATFVTGTNPRAVVSWSATSDAGSGVAAYDIYRKAPGSAQRNYLATVVPTTLQYDDATAQANVAYAYSVDSRDQAGNTATGTAAPVADPDTTPPTAPTGLVATSIEGPAVELAWNAATDDTGVTSYDIYRSGSLLSSGVSSTSFVDTNVTPITRYTYSVRARDGQGNVSGPSAEATAVTVEGPTQSIAVNPLADAQVSQANPSNNYGNSTVINVDQDPVSQMEGYLRFDLSGLSGPVTSAKLQLWTGTGSAAATSNGPSVYGVPDTTWAENALTWNNRPPASGSALDNVGAIATDTLVEYTVTPWVTGDGPVAFHLAPDSSDGAQFNPREATTATKRPRLVVTTSGTASPDTTAPTPPTQLTAEPGDGTSVRLAWLASADNIGVTGYDIYRDGALLAPGVTVRTYTDTEVIADTSYSYWVRARDAAGNESPPSNTATATAGSGLTVTTFAPVADARVNQQSPDANYGSTTILSADLGPDFALASYLKFDVTGLSGSVSHAKLRVWTTTGTTAGSSNGPGVRGVADSTWTEAGITWANQPSQDPTETDNVGAISADSLVEYIVTPLVTGNGTVTFKLAPDSNDGADFSSRQATSAVRRPQLIVTTIE